MKLNKIFAIGLAALTLTACSDDDDHNINTATGVTVHMEEATVSVMENVGLFNVPVVIEGDANGYVEVSVKVNDGTVDNDEEEPAMANAHYFVTSDHIFINPETKTANIEIRSVDFRLPQKTRSFTITIDKVNGATIAGNATTTVYILDKGSSPEFAELLTGQWLVMADGYNSETGLNEDPISFRGTAQADGDGMKFVINGGFGIQGLTLNLPMIYEWDDEVGYGDVAVRLGGIMNTAPVSFTGLGACNVKVGNSSGSINGTITGTWNSTYSSVSFGDTEFLALVYTDANDALAGYWYSWSNMTLTHVKVH